MSAIGANLQEAVERARILASRLANVSPNGIKRPVQQYRNDNKEKDSDITLKRSKSEDECLKDSIGSTLSSSNRLNGGDRAQTMAKTGDSDCNNSPSRQNRIVMTNATDDNPNSELIVRSSEKSNNTNNNDDNSNIDKNDSDGNVTNCGNNQEQFPSCSFEQQNTSIPANFELMAQSEPNQVEPTTKCKLAENDCLNFKNSDIQPQNIQQVIGSQASNDINSYAHKDAIVSALPSHIKKASAHESVAITNTSSNRTLFNDSISPQSDLLIPQQYVGLVIGKGGENIRRVQSETGATLYIDSSKMADTEGNKLCTITGSVDSVQRASALVQEIIESAKNGRQTTKRKVNEGEVEFRMKIPAPRTGVIIGRGGDTIRAIRSQTQCTIELDKDATDCGPEEKVFVITGPSERVQQAQELINARLTSCLQSKSNHGTSAFTSHGQQRQQIYPPNMSSQSSAALQYGNNLYSAYWQQHMAAQSAQQDPSGAWAAYYAQYYAAQMQSSYSGILQDKNNPPDGGGQNSKETNHTDTCDYSCQWAQYYRAHGMIKEAEWIEQQSKVQVSNQQQLPDNKPSS